MLTAAYVIYLKINPISIERNGWLECVSLPFVIENVDICFNVIFTFDSLWNIGCGFTIGFILIVASSVGYLIFFL